jgi:hypothetical protein
MLGPGRSAPAIALLVLLALPAAAADTVRTEAVGLRFSVPTRWVRVPAPEVERAAQWRLPRTGGDAQDGELVLFYFGKGTGGSAEESLARWHASFFQPDGRPSRDVSVVTVRTVRGLRVTALDLAGTYKPGPTRDGPKPPPRRGQRMLAAVVEEDDGPWFFEATGPLATIAQTKAGFDAMLDSLEAHR